MESSPRSLPHSVKRWQLSGTDYEAPPGRALRPAAREASETRFSAWTPLGNKSSNQQLFGERTRLLLHWFDLWSDRQRKHLLQVLLHRCTRSQLKFCRDLLMESVPVTRQDFTVVLPRFLSLYVMSFLNPRDLCSAAKVSWHWRVLAEQDCLWAGRCVRRGWFLRQPPGEKEFGAWKTHYVSCVASLGCLNPREAAEQYGTLHPPTTGRVGEEAREREEERRTRQVVRERLQQEKKLLVRTRRPWGSSLPPGGSGCVPPQRERPGPGVALSSGSLLTWSPGLHLSTSESSQRAAGCSSTRLKQTSGALLLSSPFTSMPPPLHSLSSVPRPDAVLLLLLSNRVPAHELVLGGVKAAVLVVLYDYRGTLPALLAQAERALAGQRIQRLGLLSPGGTENIQLLHRVSVSEQTILNPDVREFWEKLCGWVTPAEEGGGVDIFSPLAASDSGLALMQTLSTLTGLEVVTPMGLASGSFQNILSEWSGCSSRRAGLPNSAVCVEPWAPALRYLGEGVLQHWCMQAQWMEEALKDLRDLAGSRLHRVSMEAGARALGHFLWDSVHLEELCASKDLTEALVQGLAALTRRAETRPLEFLSMFLARRSREAEGGAPDGEEMGRGNADCDSQRRLGPKPDLPKVVFDWREAAARELYHSETLYLARLGSVLKVYHEPLSAALDSNRAILSSARIHIILRPLTHILQLNRGFCSELGRRMESWGADQRVGDVCVKLCSKLQVYTNYLNNYPTALRCIDKCREINPEFRAFLRRTDRTLATHTLSLQELLLCPTWRMEEYVMLLQALSVHTHPGHTDHTHLSSALHTLLQYREFILKLKRNSERDRVMEETQRLIQGCPNLCEGNRELLTTLEAVLLRSPDEDLPDALRPYEQVSDVGLFLFSDALVLTQRSVTHTPFTLCQRSTHTFLASVSLASLAVREITHTRYVCNAFVLDGPSRSWACATERCEQRERFLCALRSAAHCALAQHS